MERIYKQPNGLFCIWDTLRDIPIKWNVTEKQWISRKMNNARLSAFKDLKKSIDVESTFKEFIPDDERMSEESFNKFLKEIGSNETYDRINGCWGD